MVDYPFNRKASKQRRSSDLVAFGTAAVLTVYSAGYLRTRDAAERFAGETERRQGAALATKGPTVRAIDPPREAVQEERSRPRLPKLRREEAHAEPTVAKAAEPAAPAPAAAAPVASTPPQAAPTPAPATPADTPATATRVDTAAASPPQQAVAQPPDTSSAPANEKDRGGFKDGVYYGWGTSRHGDIQAAVEIKDGKIARASISQCLTRYSCSWVSALPPEVVQRQSAEVDVVSGATQSSNAFYYAIVEALKQAK